MGPWPFNDSILGGTHGARLPSRVDNEAWASCILESPAVFTLLPWGEWAWQEGKSSLKGNVEQLFSIFPEEKEEEIDLQQASRGIYAKYREVFLNVLTFRMAF